MLGVFALAFAFLSGLSTIGDPDFGWQLARGRWIAQHHQVFTYDVLSYTVPGASAVYPPLGGLLLYWVFLLGGYKLLSWLCAISCVATVALLLRRGSAFTAAMAILAVPFLAMRMVPRSELFAILLFAAFVSLLWQNFQTSRAPLWLLPLLMALWVNIHFSFFSGFGLLAAFAGVEVLELPIAGERRHNAIQRLKREIPWFLATMAATLANPWGWKIYKETALHRRRARHLRQRMGAAAPELDQPPRKLHLAQHERPRPRGVRNCRPDDRLRAARQPVGSSLPAAGSHV